MLCRPKRKMIVLKAPTKVEHFLTSFTSALAIVYQQRQRGTFSPVLCGCRQSALIERLPVAKTRLVEKVYRATVLDMWGCSEMEIRVDDVL